jgi:hypothetical protein
VKGEVLKGQRDMCVGQSISDVYWDSCIVFLKEVNTPLTSRVSGVCETRAESSTSKLTKQREVKSARVRPSQWSRAEGTDKRRNVPVSTFRVSRDLETRVESFDSRICEW